MKTLAYLFILICAISCKKENVKTNNGVDPEKIYGKWNWVNSTGGIAGLTITPKTAGYEASVEYKRSKSVYYYRNDTLKSQAKFSITKGNTIFSTKQAYIIKYTPDGMDHVIMKVTKDTLVLADNANDGFTILYVKDK
ncbi:MAG: hypothetical protein ABIN95_10500 [Mucilaginibacter sp.]